MPIPWTAIRGYAEAFDFDEDQTASLFHHVRVLDQAFHRYHEENPEPPKT